MMKGILQLHNAEMESGFSDLDDTSEDILINPLMIESFEEYEGCTKIRAWNRTYYVKEKCWDVLAMIEKALDKNLMVVSSDFYPYEKLEKKEV